MKKLFITFTIIGLILGLTGCRSSNRNSSIGIIGGADGPTAIFVVPKKNMPPANISPTPSFESSATQK